MGFNNFSFPNLLGAATRKRRVNPITGLEEPEELLATPPISESQPTQLVMPVGGAIKQGGGKRDMLARIMEGIASGAAIFGSNDPGQALVSQLVQRRQDALQKQQMEFEREQRQAQQDFQREMKKTEITASKESQQEEIKFKKESQVDARAHDVLLNSLEFGQKKDLQQDHIKGEESILKMRNEFNVVAASKNQEYAKEMEELKSSNDITQLETRQIMGALLSATKYKGMVPIDKVLNIIDKRKQGIALTKEDTAVIDKARQINLQSMSGSGTGGSGGRGRIPLEEKEYLDLSRTETDIIQHILTRGRTPLLNPDGTVKTGFNGQPIMVQDDNAFATAQQAITDFRRLTGFKQAEQKHIQTQTGEANITPGELQIMTNIRKGIKEGGTDQEIRDGARSLPANLKAQVEQLLKQRKNKKLTPRGF